MPAPICAGPTLAGPVDGVTAPSGASVDPAQFGMALATLLDELTPAPDRVPSGKPDAASLFGPDAPSDDGTSVPADDRSTDLAHEAPDPRGECAQPQPYGATFPALVPAAPVPATPIESTIPAIESTLPAIERTTPAIESTLPTIESAVLPIESAAIAIESAVVPIESAVLPDSARSAPAGPAAVPAGVPAGLGGRSATANTVAASTVPIAEPLRDAQRVTTPRQESASVAGPQLPVAPSPLVATGNAAPVTAAHVPPDFAAQLARPVISLAAGPPGEHVVTVRITPENLGPVTVQAHIGSDGVRIELFAPTDVGRAAVHAVLSDLRRDLAGTGLDASLDLSDRSAPPHDPAFGKDRGRGGAGAGHQGDSRSLAQTGSAGPGTVRAAHLLPLSTSVRLDVLA